MSIYTAEYAPSDFNLRSPGRQLPLDFRLDRRAVLERFEVCPANRELSEALSRFQADAGPRFLYLHGPPEEGRSHLLQGVCQGLLPEGTKSYYLPLTMVKSLPPAALLDGLDAGGLLCLDDLEAVVGDIHWERALFHFFNRVQARGGRLFSAAILPPSALSLRLPDLASRFASGAVYRLHPLGEQEQAALLRQRVKERGLRLEDNTLRFILERSQRSTGALMALLEQLDQASMAARRPLTIPFIKEICGW